LARAIFELRTLTWRARRANHFGWISSKQDKLAEANAPSVLSLIAAVFYLLVACSCVFALRAQLQSGTRSNGWPLWGWLTLVFVILAAIRFMALEDVLRDTLRGVIAQADMRSFRQSVQLPIAMMIGSGALAIIVWRSIALWRNWSIFELRMRNIAALALTGLLGLMLVRIASLHLTDAILFSGLIGPVRLNWIVDLGCSTFVLVCAILSARQHHARRGNGKLSVSNYRQ
jgi:hypothetical protein